MASKPFVDLGAQRFDKFRTRRSFYIDKTCFIKEWWEYGSDITLLTRPRRFGKTVNLSMLEFFFSNEYAGRGDLFEGLSIWKEEKFRKLQGIYPVIFMSFASIKTGETEGIKKAVKQLLFNVYSKHRDMMDSPVFTDADRKYFLSVCDEMADETAFIAINRLCSYLKKYYGKDVILLLDEYDTPMQEAWLCKNWEGAAAFFRSFFNASFKTNECLLRGLITGITRISKESIFSDLNNLKIETTTSDRYAGCFGFTEREVFRALDEAGLHREKQGVKTWYDGFTFGKRRDIYNPWSIAAFMESGGKYESYWADTSSNSLVNSLIKGGDAIVKKAMEDLIQGKSIQTELDEQIVFDQLGSNTHALWSLLLATGYLKIQQVMPPAADDTGDALYTLTLTNLEVKKMFRKMIKSWFDGAVRTPYNHFIQALLANDVEAMNEFMNTIALCIFSTFDTAKSASTNDAPERFYHGFVLGLITELTGRFTITSNRESGFGRYDVMLSPTDPEKDNAYILEFKVHRPGKEKSLEETVKNALAQIEEKQYDASLAANGFPAKRIKKYGFAFEGKKCLIG